MSDPSAPTGSDNPDENSVSAIEEIVRDLYDLMRQDIAFEDKARRALEIGRDYLDADNGHLTRIDQETDHWEAVVSTDPPDGEFPPGLELDLQTTYCRRVLDTSSQIALNDVPNQGWAEDPAYQALGLHCYVGTPLYVNGEQYGTVCFVATDPRENTYSASEKMLAELITHMLERNLEREQFETQLLRQTNLSLVLNRVIRHNLRNEMSVIRGYTQMMVEKSPDSDWGRMALRSIDKLLNLGEKARTLDEIIASNKERGQQNIRALVEEVITDVRSEYPAASIPIDGDQEVPAAIFPSFRRAVRELVENAAKHGGDQPTVEVTVELISDAIEIRIADDGPGLNNQEIDVLRSGSETPLIHGSGLGLWLTHWIISSHDGSIEASVTDAGTTLTIKVPRTPVSDVEQPSRKLLRARDQYKATFDEAGDGMTITDDEARILDVNDEAARIFGMDKQALIGRSIQEFVSDDFDFEAEWGDIQVSDRRRGEMRVMSADGGVINIEYTAKTDVVPGQHLIVSRDVTERKEREQEIERLKERLELAVEGAELGVWDWDMTTDEVELNEQYVEMLGYSKDEFGQDADALKERIHPDDRERIEDGLDAHIAGETEYFETEYRLQTAEGDWKWLRSLGHIVDRDGEGAPLRFVGVQIDISERKERETELQELKQRLETIVDLAPEPIFAVDNSGTVIRWNEAAEAAFGYPEQEAIGEQLQSLGLFNEEQSSEFEERFERVLAGETIRGLEIERERKDGTVVHLRMSATALRDGSDSVIGLIAAGQDITELKEREQKIRDLNQQLHAERQRYESLFTSIQDAILVADTDREIINCNPAFEELFGYELAEIKGKHTKFVYESEAEYEEMGEAIEGHIGDPEFTHLVTYEKKSGQTFPGETSVFYLRNPEGEIAGFIGVIRDITDLEGLINRLNIAMGGTSTGVWGWDGETDRVHWSDSIEELIGFDRETIDSSIDGLASYVHPADRVDFLETFEAAIKKVGRVVTKFRIQREDGTQIWVEARGNVQEGGDGNKQMVGIITDITDRKKREEELIQYEASFKKAGDGMTITDDEARILDVNEAAAQLYGEDKPELVGRSMTEFLPDDFDFEAEWGEILAAKMKRDEMKILSADGGVNPVEYTAKTDIVPGQHLIVSRKIASTEITEQQKRAGKLQRQNERLNEFASVVSHDLRNPLNVAKVRIAIAQEEHNSDDLDTAARGIERSLDLIGDMLTLARDGQQVSEMQPVDVGSLVETCWDDFETVNATVDVDLDWTIEAARSRIRQLLENLIGNAVEHGGDDVIVRVGALPDGFYVEDDGPGIPKDERKSVFEPGYSNSPDGTGFGLAIVRRIAEDHGWEVHVTEGADGGARFEFTDIEGVAE